MILSALWPSNVTGVLMLNFETSCANRPLHNKHENVICAKILFVEKKL